MSITISSDTHQIIKQSLDNLRHQALKWIQHNLDPQSHSYDQVKAAEISLHGMPDKDHVIGLTVFRQGKDLRIKDTYYHSTELIDADYFRGAIFGSYGRALSSFFLGVIKEVQVAREILAASPDLSEHERQMRALYSKIIGPNGEALLGEAGLRLVITFDFDDPKALRLSVSNKDFVTFGTPLPWPMVDMYIPIVKPEPWVPFTIPMTGEDFHTATEDLWNKLDRTKTVGGRYNLSGALTKIEFGWTRVDELPKLIKFSGVERGDGGPLEELFAKTEDALVGLREMLRNFVPHHIRDGSEKPTSDIERTLVFAEIGVIHRFVEEVSTFRVLMNLECRYSRNDGSFGSNGWKTIHDQIEGCFEIAD